MAALGWLLNLDFAGGGAAAPAVGSGVAPAVILRRSKRRYYYGYRYIEKGAVWITSLTPFL